MEKANVSDQNDTQPLEGASGSDGAVVISRRYAYVAALWGFSTGFVLGALTLGAGLRASGTEHELVLLHTDDVPPSSLELLSKVWQLRQVEFLQDDQRLSSSPGSCFSICLFAHK